jgi:hypothetical protein
MGVRSRRTVGRLTSPPTQPARLTQKQVNTALLGVPDMTSATFFSGGLTGASGSELEKLGRKGMKRLEPVTS